MNANFKNWLIAFGIIAGIAILMAGAGFFLSECMFPQLLIALGIMSFICITWYVKVVIDNNRS